MKIKIVAFSLMLFGVFFITSITSSFVLYSDKKEQTAKILVAGLNTTTNEIGLIVEKHLENNSLGGIQNMKDLKPFLDRRLVSDDNIDDISVFTGDKQLMFGTNPLHNIFPKKHMRVGYKDIDSYYAYLFDTDYIVSEIKYNVELKKKTAYVVVYLSRGEIQNIFKDDVVKYLIILLMFPLFITITAYIVLFRVILKPMKDLEYYAHNADNADKKPGDFILYELDSLKHSIIHTIETLETEKAQLYTLSRTDALSGLPNKKSMEEFLEKRISIAKKNNESFALLFMDIDDFKRINDIMGHYVGDILLQDVSTRLIQTKRDNDYISRIGGDEFVLIISNFRQKAGLIGVIDQISSKLKNISYSIDAKNISITTSFGISLFPHDGDTVVDLLKRADIALHEAKSNGKDRYEFFSESLDKNLQEYLDLVEDMKEALMHGQYEVYYQPQNAIDTFKIVGAEALIRWEHPTKGRISPAKFIPVAEQVGFIVDLGFWIIEQTLIKKKYWEQMGMDIKVSVNVSANQLLAHNFVPIFENLLNKYKVNRDNYCIEITEYVFAAGGNNILNTFNDIKKLGIKIYLDDFGTGYSSLSFLKKFPIDVVKIDKSFLDGIDDHAGKVFFRTIVQMSHALNMGLVAEGVETAEQLMFLREVNCEVFQGYISSKPLRDFEFEQLYHDCLETTDCEMCPALTCKLSEVKG